MSFATISAGKYTHIWQKYRPVILKLMVDSTSGEKQAYDLSSHEFLDANNKRKTGYSFSLKVYKGRNAGEKKVNVVGQELLSILQMSNKAQELTESATYHFEMDRHFKLQVSSEAKVDEDATSDDVAEPKKEAEVTEA